MKWYKIKMGVAKMLFAFRTLGFSGFGRYFQRGTSIKIIHDRLAYPVYIRGRSSDLDVFKEVVVNDDYGFVNVANPCGVIVDLGANTGISSAYFLSRYPKCRVVAVEPDPDNVSMLKRNLICYGDRATIIEAACWSHDCTLAMRAGAYRDGREWSLQFEEASGQENVVKGLSVESLLRIAGADSIALLKADIEGAEVVMFRECMAWIRKVDALVIECHDDSYFGSGTSSLRAVTDQFKCQILKSGLLTYCKFEPHASSST